MHLDEEQIQRLLHGEIVPRAEASLREHVAECAECRARLDAAQADEVSVLDLLRKLDHATPGVRVETIVSAAGRRMPGWGRIAAALLLALAGAGVAYAAPGSPLPRLVQRVAEWIGAVGRPQAPVGSRTDSTSRPLGAPSGAASGGAGVAVPPGERLAIVFAPEQPGSATVSLGDSADVVVRGLDGATTFTSDVDRLSVELQASTRRFEIVIPRGARHVEIRVGERRVYLKEGSRVVTEGVPDGEGRYLVRLGG